MRGRFPTRPRGNKGLRLPASRSRVVVAALWAISACGDSETSAGEKCPRFSAGLKVPARVATSFERIAGVGDLRFQTWIDEGGIYWFDRAGALYALRHGETGPVVLRAAPPSDFELLGMIGDETHLYWGEADARRGGIPDPSPPPPPGRLFAVAKAGGPTQLLLEAASDLLTPIGVSPDRVIAQRSSAQLTAVAKDGSSSQPLAMSPRGDAAPFAPAPKVIADRLYWSVPDEKNSDVNGYVHHLWRANLDGSAASRVARMDSEAFLGAGDVILWRQERTHLQPLVHEENYVMLDQRTGCIQPLPALGLSISSDSLTDGEHVYWFSFNGLGVVSPGDPAIGKPLIRVDLRTGALEQLDTPGFTATLGDNFVGQTRDRLYVTVNGKGLVAIDKP